MNTDVKVFYDICDTDVFELSDNVTSLMTDFTDISAYEAYERYNSLNFEDQLTFDYLFVEYVDMLSKSNVEHAKKMIVARIDMTLCEIHEIENYTHSLVTSEKMSPKQLHTICGVGSIDELNGLRTAL